MATKARAYGASLPPNPVCPGPLFGDFGEGAHSRFVRLTVTSNPVFCRISQVFLCSAPTADLVIIYFAHPSVL